MKYPISLATVKNIRAISTGFQKNEGGPVQSSAGVAERPANGLVFHCVGVRQSGVAREICLFYNAVRVRYGNPFKRPRDNDL